jgi:HD-GYP domain-containing protein (c-di-GMP phosphodiesterase class II)
MNAPGLRLLRLVQRQVVVGQPLPFSVRDEHGKLLLARGQMVDDDAQLAALLERGAYVDAEEARAVAQSAAAAGAAPSRKLTLFDLWEQLIWHLERVLRSTDEPGLPARLDELAGMLLALVRREPDVGIYLAIRQDPKRLSVYGLTHSLYTAMACALASWRLGWAEADTLRLVKAALTMNMTIVELQGRLATQGNKPTESQFERLRAHPHAAADLLASAGVDDALWLDALRQHHERRDGAGYPRGVADIAPLAVALRQADVLLAKVSPRTGRAPLPIQQAHREMFAECGGDPFASALIKEFGIYPPGDFVLLRSGEMAVVVRRGASANTPEVAAITDRKGMPVTSSARRDTARPEFAIAGPATDRSMVLRLQPERLFGLVT